jgi:NAD-dependent SIR2 family protein deacetylase
VIAGLKKKVPVHCTCGGFVKPDIVFFGEELPERYWHFGKIDFPACRLLIVIGTSLKVYPFAGMVDWVNVGVPKFLINAEKAGEFDDGENQENNFFIQGDCDVAVKEVVRRLGWEADLGKFLNKG